MGNNSTTITQGRDLNSNPVVRAARALVRAVKHNYRIETGRSYVDPLGRPDIIG